jgi:hypothetical protein
VEGRVECRADDSLGFQFAQSRQAGVEGDDGDALEASTAAAPGNAALTNLMESGTNGAATIISNSRQNLGNLGCWGVGGFEKTVSAFG